MISNENGEKKMLNLTLLTLFCANKINEKIQDVLTE